MARVIALEKGHDGVAVREVGEEFDVDLDATKFKGCTWFVEKDKAPTPKAANAKARPPGAGPERGSRAKADAEGDLA